MASHNRTPASVLEAPKAHRVYLVRHTGDNRETRRHVKYTKTGPTYLIPKAERMLATNVPYQSPARVLKQAPVPIRRYLLPFLHKR